MCHFQNKKVGSCLSKHEQQAERWFWSASWYLEVKVGDALAVHESQPLQDLLHELNGLALQQDLLLSDEVKQLPSTHTETSNTSVCYCELLLLFCPPAAQARDKVANT